MSLSEQLLIILDESRRDRYSQMFPKPEVFGEDQEHYKQFIYFAEKMLDWAIKILKREDRIIWFMRWYLLIAGKAPIHVDRINSPQRSGVTPPPEAIYKKAEKNLLRIGVPQAVITKYASWYESSITWGNEMASKFNHYMALPIHDIQSTVFTIQTPAELFISFEKIEKKWLEDRKGTIDDEKIRNLSDEDRPEVLIDFKDGFVLLDLKMNGCRMEADAMGHCSTGAHDGDTNWSIREKVTVHGKPAWRPQVTIIWNEDGWVNEIKGRGNQKPSPKFHKYIVAALLLDRVEGHLWPHGGYGQENDFTVADLPREEQEQIWAKKPSLFPAPLIAERIGFTNESIGLLNKSMELKFYGDDKIEALPEDHYLYGKYGVLGEFEEGKELIEEFPSDAKIRDYIGYLDGSQDADFDGNPGNDTLKEILEGVIKKKPEFLDYCRTSLRLDGDYDSPEEVDEMDEDDLLDAVLEGDGEYLDEIQSRAKWAYQDGERSGFEGQVFKAVESALEDAGLIPKVQGQSVVFSPCYLAVNASLFKEVLSAPEGENTMYYLSHGENKHDIDVPYYGFGEYDEDSAIESFLDHHIHELPDLPEPGIEDGQQELVT